MPSFLFIIHNHSVIQHYTLHTAESIIKSNKKTEIINQTEQKRMYSLCISLLKEDSPILIALCITYEN
jgi:hypothetical protein